MQGCRSPARSTRERRRLSTGPCNQALLQPSADLVRPVLTVYEALFFWFCFLCCKTTEGRTTRAFGARPAANLRSPTAPAVLPGPPDPPRPFAVTGQRVRHVSEHRRRERRTPQRPGPAPRAMRRRTAGWPGRSREGSSQRRHPEPTVTSRDARHTRGGRQGRWPGLRGTRPARRRPRHERYGASLRASPLSEETAPPRSSPHPRPARRPAQPVASPAGPRHPHAQPDSASARRRSRK